MTRGNQRDTDRKKAQKKNEKKGKDKKKLKLIIIIKRIKCSKN